MNTVGFFFWQCAQGDPIYLPCDRNFNDRTAHEPKPSNVWPNWTTVANSTCTRQSAGGRFLFSSARKEAQPTVLYFLSSLVLFVLLIIVVRDSTILTNWIDILKKVTQQFENTNSTFWKCWNSIIQMLEWYIEDVQLVY